MKICFFFVIVAHADKNDENDIVICFDISKLAFETLLWPPAT